jgi:Hypothetical methyltransferase
MTTRSHAPHRPPWPCTCRAAQEVHGFDLVATAPGVTACNMADVPLSDGSVDAVIFCLALMGTDYGAFLQVWYCADTSRVVCQTFVGSRWQFCAVTTNTCTSCRLPDTSFACAPQHMARSRQPPLHRGSAGGAPGAEAWGLAVDLRGAQPLHGAVQWRQQHKGRHLGSGSSSLSHAPCKSWASSWRAPES